MMRMIMMMRMIRMIRRRIRVMMTYTIVSLPSLIAILFPKCILLLYVLGSNNCTPLITNPLLLFAIVLKAAVVVEVNDDDDDDDEVVVPLT